MKFIETMKLENGKILNIDLHKTRAEETIRHHFGTIVRLPFELLVPGTFPTPQGIFKLKVIYSRDIEDFTIEPYVPRVIKKLKIVDGGDIEYSYKYEDRSAIERLADKKEDCDDILIIKNGFVTDTSYSNIILSEGGKLYTPSTYLLNGIKRRKLLMSGVISEREIRVKDIPRYEGCFLINAMLDNLKVDHICQI